jgi:hypothetical protein
MSTKPFIYVSGDKDKTPVKLEDQKQGTELVRVDSRGLETPFIMGKIIKNDPETRVAAWKKHL